MRALIVGGTFDADGGKESKIITEMAQSLGWDFINGGSIDKIREFDPTNLDVLLWMPNINNDEDKILPSLKKQWQRMVLISSKRAEARPEQQREEYSHFEVVSRLLKTKSNLGIMIQKDEGRFSFSLMDPLGNRFIKTQRVSELSSAIANRVNTLKSLTRIGSSHAGQPPKNITLVSDAFIQTVRTLGDEFSTHVNAVNPERLLGNAAARDTYRSTRCTHGFPSVRAGDNTFWISRRNVDKQTMNSSDFVLVGADENRVNYYGDPAIKPSVDSPIQIRLFNFYSNVSFMVHGHVYAENAPTTKSKVPCGHIEEFDEIKALFPDPQTTNFTVNLKGHGCLILSNNLEYLQNATFESRPLPEV
ncbi:MAG: class II aldolase/adducin family protein [Alphaproteobacteria bacterium]